jgi:integrase/recombinase XerD
LKAATQSNKITAVLAFLRYLYEERLILANPGQHLRRPRVPDSLPPDVPDEEQVLKLLQTPDTSTVRGLRDRAILEVFYATAIRNAELRALRISDIDLHRLELDVRCGKGGKGRRLPLGEPAAAWIEEYLTRSRPALVRELQDDTLFLNTWGGPLKADVLCKLVRRNAEAAGLGMRVTAHILRHACATHMLARKAGIRHLQQFLGHKLATSTQSYTRVEISDLREVFLQCHPRENS